MTQNQIAYWNLKETERANRAREKENYRANVANEKIRSRSNDITYQLGDRNATETVRANLAKELENNRTNMSNEDIRRANNAIQLLENMVHQYDAETKRGQLAYSYANLAEIARSNRANEGLRGSELLEANRANLAREQENYRSNLAKENATRFANAASAGTNITSNTLADLRNQETQRHNVAVESETKRSNLVNQQFEAAKQLEQINNDKFKIYVDLLRNLSPNISLRAGGTR